MSVRPTFGLVDYCVFGATLLLSLLIGVYHAVRGKQTNEDLLLGGRSMSVLPVAVSIMVSFLSAILILGERGSDSDPHIRSISLGWARCSCVVNHLNSLS